MDNHFNKTADNASEQIIIRTPSPAAKEAFFYILEAGIIKTAEICLSKTDSFLFAVITSGNGELTFDGNVYPLSKGDCFFIDCRVPHCCKSCDNGLLEIMWIHFNGSTSSQYYEYFTAYSKNVFHPADFDGATAAISEIIYFNEQNNPNAEVLTSGLIVRLLTISLIAGESSSRKESALKQKLAAVNSYIEEHFNEDLSLERLSSEFYISKFYLTREYKKIYGMTIFQHIIACRINYGKKLLRFSDKSVEEIAHLCGFKDQSYFVRRFKKAENVTCYAYRRMWRQVNSTNDLGIVKK